jgi:NAD(P)-dependent dehydrogenase (short-subunit alcohol dehydrogenase family)
MKLKDRVAIVTGGARGIGKCFASRFSKEGAKVVVVDILDGSETIKMIKNMGGEALALTVDVSNEKEVLEMSRQVVEKFGRIDILVNNAAINADFTHRKPFYEITGEEWDRTMAINAKGMFLCAKSVFPQMKKQGGGKIINLCSTTMFKGVPYCLHYVSSKGAIAAFTRSLARELGEYGINVNAIAPGLTITEVTEPLESSFGKYIESRIAERTIKRKEKPHDLEGTAVFLASNDSDFITGQVIVVDGGAVMN